MHIESERYGLNIGIISLLKIDLQPGTFSDKHFYFLERSYKGFGNKYKKIFTP